jgi:hypothetical protein
MTYLARKVDLSGSKNIPIWFEKRTYLAGKIDLSGWKIYKSGSKIALSGSVKRTYLVGK